jgi:AcrR family transcriptional regulator
MSHTAVTPDKPPMRERILLAADRLFYGTGINAIGVDAVAAEAGISKRTLYNHFPSKDDLITAYLERRAGYLLMPMADEGDPRELILGVFDALARGFASKRFRGCPFVNAVTELGADHKHPAVMLARELKLRRRDWFARQCRALKVDRPKALAEQLVVLVEGAIATSLVRGGDPACAQAAQNAARTLLASAGVHEPKTSRH